MSELTPAMRRALWECGFGVRVYEGRWRSIDCPDTWVNSKSLDALARRELLWGYTSICGSVMLQARIGLTAEGEAIFENLRAKGYDPPRGRVW